jgi:hypothetical protein
LHFNGHAQFGVGNRGASCGKKRWARNSAAAEQASVTATTLTACHGALLGTCSLLPLTLYSTSFPFLTGSDANFSRRMVCPAVNIELQRRHLS